MRHVLITGGGGFIGSHLAKELLESGVRVRVLDNLSPQVHSDRTSPPHYLSSEVEFRLGDIRDLDTCRSAVRGVDAVCHLAAAVGVGQSMYKSLYYTDVNELGTAVLLHALERSSVEKLVVASSMSIYGEGLYKGKESGEIADAVSRSAKHLDCHRWDPVDPHRKEQLEPIATPEEKRAELNSVYALNKFAQEKLCLLAGEARGLDVTALRFFNVYGRHQALSNPYTGVLAIFGSRLLNNKQPRVYEDGRQRRDFVHVTDVARACRLALEQRDSEFKVYNVGSGNSITIAELAEKMAALLELPLAPHITQTYRQGDIRHCFADISKAEKHLGWKPHVKFEDGMQDLVDWLAEQDPEDNSDRAQEELRINGLSA